MHAYLFHVNYHTLTDKHTDTLLGMIVLVVNAFNDDVFTFSFEKKIPDVHNMCQTQYKVTIQFVDYISCHTIIPVPWLVRPHIMTFHHLIITMTKMDRNHNTIIYSRIFCRLIARHRFLCGSFKLKYTIAF